MLPSVQTAYTFKRGSREIVRRDDWPVARPEDNQVLLKVEAVGLCMSDVHILMAQETHVPETFVMGHEIAGQIAAVGGKLSLDPRYKVGNRFTVCIGLTCGRCANCRNGHDNCCTGNGKFPGAYGLNRDGGFQQYLLITDLNTLLPLPDGLSYEMAAVSSDSVLTPLHAVHKVKPDLVPTAKILVMGLGGLGSNAVQIIKNYGCHVVACDVKPELEEFARQCGADEFYTDINSSPHEPELFDVCFDFCGFQETFDSCQKYAQSGGKIVVVGLGRSKLMLRNYDSARRSLQVIFSFGGTASSQEQLLQWVKKGIVKPLVTNGDFAELPQYLKRLAKGEVKGRVVFRPSKL